MREEGGQAQSTRRALSGLCEKQDGLSEDFAASQPVQRSPVTGAAGAGPSRQCVHVAVVILSLVLLNTGIITSKADTLEQVRGADYKTNCGMGFTGLMCSEVITCESLSYCTGHGICVRGGECTPTSSHPQHTWFSFANKDSILGRHCFPCYFKDWRQKYFSSILSIVFCI